MKSRLLGYATSADKVAVLSRPINGFNAALTYTAPAAHQVRNSTTNAIGFTGPVGLWNGESTYSESGDQGWWFDFSAVNTAGSYYVYDATTDQKSAVFNINGNPYGNVLVALTKMFYYNRSNLAKQAPFAQAKWTDGTNFLNALQDATCRMPIAGLFRTPAMQPLHPCLLMLPSFATVSRD